MIDTHAHLDALDDAPQALARAREAGVGRVVTIGTTLDSCRAMLELAEREEGVFVSLGLHPHEAGEAGRAEVAEIRTLIDHPKAVAVGETGPDHFRDYAPHDRQLELFRAQTELAVEADKPIVVHTRAAEDDTLAVLTSLPETARVVLHCFSSLRLLGDALERSWFVSFAGNVTYPKAQDLAAAAERVPDDRLLVETDAPYLTPQVVRKERNQPAYVTHTARFVAERRGVSYEELEALVERNAAGLFGW